MVAVCLVWFVLLVGTGCSGMQVSANVLDSFHNRILNSSVTLLCVFGLLLSEVWSIVMAFKKVKEFWICIFRNTPVRNPNSTISFKVLIKI